MSHPAALPSNPSLEQQKKRAKELLKAFRASEPDAQQRVRERHPRPAAFGDPSRFGLVDAQLVIAREYGFASWPKLKEHIEAARASGVAPESPFDRAARCVVDGEIETLRRMLRDDPALTKQRSDAPHRCTLLHYTAANGIADELQKPQPLAPQIAALLLEAGAEPDALAETYGGGPSQTTLCLAVSSVWPFKAGVQDQLVDVLLDHGAKVDGVAGQGEPLATAIAFGYRSAAETLARRGAKLACIQMAAALGDTERMKPFFGSSGRLLPGAGGGTVKYLLGHESDQAALDASFVYACMHRRFEAAQLLLDRGATIGAKGNQGMTALHYAVWYGHDETIDFLLERHAPLETKNAYGGTVLGFLAWVVQNQPNAEVDHYGYMERLIAAGADLDALTPWPTKSEKLNAFLKKRGKT